jgi:peptidoglycan/LPS O-acetylase OafA/YrhL
VLRNFVLPLFVVLLLWGLITEKTWLQKLLATSVMQLLGNASFLFYLIHIGYTNQKFASWFLGFDRNFILLWGIAIVGYVVIEKPLYNLCKKAIQKI